MKAMPEKKVRIVSAIAASFTGVVTGNRLYFGDGYRISDTAFAAAGCDNLVTGEARHIDSASLVAGDDEVL